MTQFRVVAVTFSTRSPEVPSRWSTVRALSRSLVVDGASGSTPPSKRTRLSNTGLTRDGLTLKPVPWQSTQSARVSRIVGTTLAGARSRCRVTFTPVPAQFGHCRARASAVTRPTNTSGRPGSRVTGSGTTAPIGSEIGKSGALGTAPLPVAVPAPGPAPPPFPSPPAR